MFVGLRFAYITLQVISAGLRAMIDYSNNKIGRSDLTKTASNRDITERDFYALRLVIFKYKANAFEAAHRICHIISDILGHNEKFSPMLLPSGE